MSSLFQSDLFENKVLKFSQALIPEDPKNLKDSISYSLLGGGKRLRPRLLFAVGESLGLESDLLYQCGIAVEMVHTYSLIHDDLPSMDNDDLRRGKPTNHKVYGEAIALLAGDALIALANDALLQATPLLYPSLNSNEEAFARTLLALQVLNTSSGVRGIIQGQALELKFNAPDSSPNLEELLTIFRLKTGSLFEACVLIPAYLSGLKRSDSTFQTLKDYANAYGVLYQIADDLEDFEVSSKSIRDKLDPKLLQQLIQTLSLTLDETQKSFPTLKAINETLYEKIKKSKN